MKKLLLPFFFAIFTFPLTAQDWFRAGEQWTYDVTTGFDNSNYGLHSIHIGGDSVVLGQVWRKLIYTQISQPPFVFLARQSGDQILGLHPFSSGVSTIYDFTKAPGDSIFYAWNRFYIILDTGSMVVAGQWRKRQVVRFGADTISRLLIEHIGMTGRAYQPEFDQDCSFLPIQFPFCEGFVDGYSMFFRCYQSPEGAIYSPLNICLSSQATEAEREELAAVPAPNPCTEQFSLSAALDFIRMYRLDGRLVSAQDTKGQFPVRITTSDLSGGMYILEGVDAKGNTRFWKIMVGR